jgi:hypothetical protein
MFPIWEQLFFEKRSGLWSVFVCGSQYLFPSRKLSKDPRSGKTMRHHVLESGLQKAVKHALNQAKIHKKAGCHKTQKSIQPLHVSH